MEWVTSRGSGIRHELCNVGTWWYAQKKSGDVNYKRFSLNFLRPSQFLRKSFPREGHTTLAV